jgi:parvulin-like peptidyl-prolyl isomerase
MGSPSPLRRPAAALALPLLFAASCAHESPPPAALLNEPPPSAAADAPPPALIAVRVLLVGHKDEATGSGPERTRPEALERARMLSTMAKQSDKLSDLVMHYSDRPGASEDQGVVRLRTADPSPFPPAVVEAALPLPVGGVSRPIETAQGYVVLERLTNPPLGPERISARHILISHAGSSKPAPGVTRSAAEARALAEQIAGQAHAPGADFTALAKQYTEEPQGKERAGDLGAFGRGQMVPAFEKAAFALNVGEVSAVVETPFGFHIIERYK